MQIQNKLSSPDDCAVRIYEISGHVLNPELAEDLWSKILQHKWVLSDKIGRDVGFKVACIDLIEIIVSIENASHNGNKIRQLKRV